MRRTTKIFLGVLASIFIITFFFIIYLSTIDTSKSCTHRTIEDKFTSVKIADYKTVILEAVNKEKKDEHLYLNGKVTIQPTDKTEDKKILLIPVQMKDDIDVKSKGDTLIIEFKIDNISSYIKEIKNGFGYQIYNINLKLKTDSSINFISNINRIGVSLQDLNLETANVEINDGDIDIDRCQFRTLNPAIKYWGKFTLKNSKINDLTIDLDKMRTWEVNNCDIETENLSGSRTHNVKIPKGECQTMNWYPIGKEAQLKVVILSDTAKITFP